jgi:PAS domain S-box-containing protein
LSTVASESLDVVEQAMKNALEHGAAETEAWLVAKSGVKIPCYLTGVRILFENEPCVVGVAIDISKRKRTEEHDRLQTAALESAANGIVITDVSGNIQWVNPAFSRLTGYTREEALGKNPRILKSGKQDESVYRRLWSSILSGEIWSGEITNRRKDGQLYNEEMTIAPVRSISGEITNFVAIKQDVTERKRVEAALAESTARLHAVLQAATQMSIIATDRDGMITVFNPGAEKMLGYTAEEVVGKKTPEIFHIQSEVQARGRELTRELGHPIEGFRVLVEQARHDGFEEREWTYVRKDGTWLTVLLVVTELPDVHGRVTGFLGMAKDITVRKRAEEELRSTLQMKSDFVSFVTHQLRTPLTGIKWLLELLGQSEQLSAETRSLLGDTRESTDRLIRLVNDLLEVSRLEDGKLVLAQKETDLRDLTLSVLKDLGPQIQIQEDEVSVHGDDRVPPVRIDPQLFRQVILNLISNAIKYTPAKGKIDIEVAGHNGHLRWTIRDNGIGIPKASQARLFEKFFRAENGYKMETEGTGLGLYIVRLVVERSHGRVWCKSEEGKGSTFAFELPLAGVR